MTATEAHAGTTLNLHPQWRGSLRTALLTTAAVIAGTIVIATVMVASMLLVDPTLVYDTAPLAQPLPQPTAEAGLDR